MLGWLGLSDLSHLYNLDFFFTYISKYYLKCNTCVVIKDFNYNSKTISIESFHTWSTFETFTCKINQGPKGLWMSYRRIQTDAINECNLLQDIHRPWESFAKSSEGGLH